VKVRRFDPDDDLIVIKARVFGTHGDRLLNLALDTAASHPHISPDIIDELGYSPVQGEAITSVRSTSERHFINGSRREGMIMTSAGWAG
jgi:hypothetical protein